MQRIFYIALFYFCTGMMVFGQAEKRICLTIDDLPVVSYGVKDVSYWQNITDKITTTCKTKNVPAIGYVNEGKLYQNGVLQEDRVALLATWLQQGLTLGNHTYSHANFHKNTIPNYRKEILKGERVTRKLMEQHNQNLQYFRHPYLRLGETKERADSLTNLLNELDYIPAPVTIDNEDYLFAKAYHIAWSREDSLLMDSIGETYVTYMLEKVRYFENQSDSLFSRPIGQTWLMHANLLNSRYLPELIEGCMALGYTFVSQEEILKDPVYQKPFTVYRDWGISWIDRWALTEGKKGPFFKEDPATPEFIHKILKKD